MISLRGQKTMESKSGCREGVQANAEAAIITIIEAGGAPVA
jgi:hypothetical protein